MHRLAFIHTTSILSILTDGEGRYRETCERDLGNALTVKDVCEMYGKSRKSVELAIATSRLFAQKYDAEEGKRGGVWLVSRTSADALWGNMSIKDEEYANVE